MCGENERKRQFIQLDFEQLDGPIVEPDLESAIEFIRQELNGLSPGEELRVTASIIEMTEGEFNKLPEFEGF